jgi:hypothetical protein
MRKTIVGLVLVIGLAACGSTHTVTKTVTVPVPGPVQEVRPPACDKRIITPLWNAFTDAPSQATADALGAGIAACTGATYGGTTTPSAPAGVVA